MPSPRSSNLSPSRRKARKDLLQFTRFCPQHVRLTSANNTHAADTNDHLPLLVGATAKENQSRDSHGHKLVTSPRVENNKPFSSLSAERKTSTSWGPRSARLPPAGKYMLNQWPLDEASSGRYKDGLLTVVTTSIESNYMNNRKSDLNPNSTNDEDNEDKRIPLILVSTLLPSSSATDGKIDLNGPVMVASSPRRNIGPPLQKLSTPKSHVASQLVEGRSYYYGLYTRPSAEYQIDQMVTKAINGNPH